MWEWLRETYIEPSQAPPSPTGSSGGDGRGKAIAGPAQPHQYGGAKNIVEQADHGGGSSRPPLLASRLARVEIPDHSQVVDCWAVAIDFETANASFASACSVGVAWLRRAEIAHRAHVLLRPPGNRFDVGNIRVHGITAADVEDEPEFPAVWERLASHLQGKVVLAHNAAFDSRVLRETLCAYDLPVPNLKVRCTLDLSRTAWPQLKRHRLPDVAEHLRIPLRHHHALADAEACALIAVQAAIRLRDPALMKGIGEDCDGSLPVAVPSRPEVHSTSDGSSEGARDHLCGLTFVVSGVLDSMSREAAVASIKAAGGRTVSAVSPQVDILVAGVAPGPAKIRTAESLQAKGCALRIIGEADFIELLERGEV